MIATTIPFAPPRPPERSRRVRHQTKKTAECFDSAQQPCSSTSIKSSKNCPCNSCGESYVMAGIYLIICFRHRLPERSRRGRIPIKSSKNCIAILVAKVTKDHTFLLNQTLSPRLPERSRRVRHQTKKQQNASTPLSSPA